MTVFKIERLCIFVVIFILLGCENNSQENEAIRSTDSSGYVNTTDTTRKKIQDEDWRPTVTFEQEDVSTALLSSTTLVNSDTLGQPIELRLVDSDLIISDGSGLPPLHVVDASNGEYVASIGEQGQGPGEYQSVADMLPMYDTCFGALDSELRRITKYCQGEESEGWVRKGQTSFQIGAPITDAVHLSGGLFAFIGFFRERRLAFYDSTGSYIRTTGPIPPGDEEIPVPVRQHAYQSFLSHHSETDQIVVGTRHADFIEVYSPRGERTVLIHGPRQFTPTYNWRMRGDTPSMVQTPDTRFGYVDVEVGGNRIYALYSGQIQSEAEGLAHMGAELFVFDLEGNPINHYELDQRVIAMEVNESGDTVYGSVLHPRPIVVQYRLPE